jgi:HEAT repeat protein
MDLQDIEDRLEVVKAVQLDLVNGDAQIRLEAVKVARLSKLKEFLPQLKELLDRDNENSGFVRMAAALAIVELKNWRGL